jgi:hypothetical protein
MWAMWTGPSGPSGPSGPCLPISVTDSKIAGQSPAHTMRITSTMITATKASVDQCGRFIRADRGRGTRGSTRGS